MYMVKIFVLYLKYIQMDISKLLSDEDINKIGQFDFIRMQHVFEHFTFEEADIVLNNCALLLKKGGFLLISIPDLDIFIKLYRKTL